jgi:hypothetical protein
MARILPSTRQECHAVQRLTRSETDVARQILAYFLRNPRAADSAEGVARWRVMDEQIRTSVRETFAALQWLVAKGYLEESSSRSSETIFRLHAARSGEAHKLVFGPRPGSRRQKP